MFAGIEGEPEVGEILFSALAWATHPVQTAYEITIVDMGGENGCRIIFRRGNMIATYPSQRDQCDKHITTFLALSPFAPAEAPHAQDSRQVP